MCCDPPSEVYWNMQTFSEFILYCEFDHPAASSTRLVMLTARQGGGIDGITRGCVHAFTVLLAVTARWTNCPEYQGSDWLVRVFVNL